MFPFFDLPEEIQAKILSYQNFQSVLKWQKTCKYMANLLKKYRLDQPKIDLLSILPLKNGIVVRAHILKDNNDPIPTPLRWIQPEIEHRCYNKIVLETELEVESGAIKKVLKQIRETKYIYIREITITAGFYQGFKAIRSCLGSTKCLTLCDCDFDLSFSEFIDFLSFCSTTDINGCKVKQNVYEQVDEKVLLRILPTTNFSLCSSELSNGYRNIISNSVLELLMNEEKGRFDKRICHFYHYSLSVQWHQMVIFIKTMFRKQVAGDIFFGSLAFGREEINILEMELKDEFKRFRLFIRSDIYMCTFQLDDYSLTIVPNTPFVQIY